VIVAWIVTRSPVLIVPSSAFTGSTPKSIVLRLVAPSARKLPLPSGRAVPLIVTDRVIPLIVSNPVTVDWYSPVGVARPRYETN
jgi:hypothetical protein